MADKKFTIDFSDPAWKYEVSSEVTPEELAQVISSLYYHIKGEVFGPYLEAHGHTNAAQRYEDTLTAFNSKATDDALAKLQQLVQERAYKELPAVQPLQAFDHGKAIAYDMPKGHF